ncbi:MAG: hypothetical protein P1U65_15835 [Minwuia sp.]|nr:hypothetical protein [Minwuia sp.]
MKDGENRTSNDTTSHEALDADQSPLVPDILPDADLFDVADYADDLAELDISEAQAAEILGIIWRMMSAMVDLGLGVDSIHNLLPSLAAISGGIEPHDLDSEIARLADEFSRSAEAGSQSEKEES